MNKLFGIPFALILLITGGVVHAQFGLGTPGGGKPKLADVVQWKWHIEPESPVVGQEAVLVFEATIDEGWYMYSSDFDPECGPIVTSFEYTSASGHTMVGTPIPVNSSKKFDDVFGCEYTYFKKKGTFRQKFTVNEKEVAFRTTINYQACTDQGKCIPYEKDFDIALTAKVAAKIPLPKPVATPTPESVEPPTSQGISDSAFTLAVPEPKDTATAIDTVATAGPIKVDADVEEEKKSMWGFLLAAFLAGFAALATPCVWPMIPMTVSYFTKNKAGGGKKKALFYSLSIIIIYTLLGVLVSLLLGADAANSLSTHWLPNLIFFAVFTFFGLSFLGMFEIVLPSSWVNSVDAQADRGGYRGVFFMAFTLVLVSFSCTGPIVGSLLVQASQGDVLQPVLGMVAYSLAVALPFGLFAFFPSMMNSLPKSGSWLNTVKVTLGFLELALALKFLSLADQVYAWGILDREIFLAGWIAIFGLLTVYLLGHIRLPHDDEGDTKISVPRLLIATVSLSFTLYLLPGMWGAPLNGLAGILPPEHTQDFYLHSPAPASAAEIEEALPILPVKHSEKLHLPHRLQGYFDYNQALEASAASGKPVFIDFTGHGCVNCRKMEQNVWSDPQVLEILQKEFIIVALYVDDPKLLPENEWYMSSHDQKIKKTLGKQNADLQITKFGNNAQPFYAIVDKNGAILAMPGEHYDLNPSNFLMFLRNGLEKKR